MPFCITENGGGRYIYLLKFRMLNRARYRIWFGVNKIFWKNNEEADVNRNTYGYHRAQARVGLDFIVPSVASEMLTFKKFCAVIKAFNTNFFQKNFFLPHA